MTVKRDTRFVSLRYLHKLMAGEDHCAWAAWFKTNYDEYKKEKADWTSVMTSHAQILMKLREEKRKTKEEVYMMDQNKFLYTVPSGLQVSGQPDLVSVAKGMATIYNCETHQPRPSDKVLVMLQMHFAALALPKIKGIKLAGGIMYFKDKVDIPPEAVDEKFIEKVNFILQKLDSDTPLKKIPKESECQFCEIGRKDCPERIG